jgi:FlaA1/EpsC-like NDP-sugar epimerase
LVISIEALTQVVTRREEDLFGRDIEARSNELEQTFNQARVLVVGGAGSIGSATVRRLLPYKPAAVHVVDHDENRLAELVRDLRASALAHSTAELKALPLDLGSNTMASYLSSEPPFDVVLNFAALKHVRSEKGTHSLLQMLDTNLSCAARLLKALRHTSAGCRYFAVSTDKAARPTSLMGASKRLMEELIFSDRDISAAPVTSARFANVAFSAGSLLDALVLRVGKHQIVAVPEGTQRYFMSASEAAGICLLATACTPDRHLLVPTLDPGRDLQELLPVVGRVLASLGLAAREYRDEDEARAELERDLAASRYPVLVTPLDTDGEKPYEEFVGSGERAEDIGLLAAMAVRHIPGPEGALDRFMSRLDATLANPEASIDKALLAEWMLEAVPDLAHAATGRSLDDRV